MENNNNKLKLKNNRSPLFSLEEESEIMDGKYPGFIYISQIFHFSLDVLINLF